MNGKRAVGKVIIVVTGLLILSLIAGLSCKPAAQPSPTPSPTASPSPTVKPSPTATPSPTVKPIVLKLGNWVAKGVVHEVATRWYADEVEKRTGGRVKFDHYYAESLATGKEGLDAIKAGIQDVAFLNPNYYPGKLPLMSVGILPPYPIDIWPTYMAYYKLYNEVPEIQKELAGWNTRLLTCIGTSGYQLTSRLPLAKISDLKGQKMRAVGNVATLLQEFGVVPVSMLYPEVFEAIQRGTIDGSIGGPVVIITYSVQEVCKYYFDLPVGGMTYFLGINNDAFNKLPADIQKIMTDPKFVEEAISAYHRIYQVEGDGASLQKMIAAGVKINKPTNEEVNTVVQLCKDKIWPKWVADMNSKGLPGQKVLDAFVKYINEYTPLNPFKK